MMQLFKIIFDAFRSNNTRNADVLRLAQTEYPKDWEHAYYMLMQGKKPYTGV